MGILYDLDHVIRDKQRENRVRKQKEEQLRRDADKAQKLAREVHERHMRGGIY